MTPFYLIAFIIAIIILIISAVHFKNAGFVGITSILLTDVIFFFLMINLTYSGIQEPVGEEINATTYYHYSGGDINSTSTYIITKDTLQDNSLIPRWILSLLAVFIFIVLLVVTYFYWMSFKEANDLAPN